jgi:hypothetical protein
VNLSHSFLANIVFSLVFLCPGIGVIFCLIVVTRAWVIVENTCVQVDCGCWWVVHFHLNRCWSLAAAAPEERGCCAAWPLCCANSLTCCVQVAFRQCNTQLIVMCVCCVGECLRVGLDVELLQVNLVCGRTSCSFCRTVLIPAAFQLNCRLEVTTILCVPCRPSLLCV